MKLRRKRKGREMEKKSDTSKHLVSTRSECLLFGGKKSAAIFSLFRWQNDVDFWF